MTDNLLFWWQDKNRSQHIRICARATCDLDPRTDRYQIWMQNRSGEGVQMGFSLVYTRLIMDGRAIHLIGHTKNWRAGQHGMLVFVPRSRRLTFKQVMPCAALTHVMHLPGGEIEDVYDAMINALPKPSREARWRAPGQTVAEHPEH